MHRTVCGPRPPAVRLDRAIRIGNRLAEFRPLYYEEPVPPQNLEALKVVRTTLGIHPRAIVGVTMLTACHCRLPKNKKVRWRRSCT